MKSEEVRQRFLDFFARHGHQVVPSSSLVPANDPTLLFTNAGMVQFKEVFQGHEKRSYSRAASSQRCVRAGGKHNDLENVGYTARHHTFFEMLGNFSFGDYFKREAIHFAWDFLTQDLKVPPEKLWITIYKKDDEAEAIWLNEIGVDPKRFSRLGEKDNFWSMGDTGPCGPCSEIFYDHGAEIPGGPPGSIDADGDRYVEIWNLVFTQYNRDIDGKMEPLPKPSVDTGMGLERMAAVMQGVHSNYEIDLFQDLIKAAASLLGIKKTSHNHSLQVIADHIRAVSFLITDGVIPSNEGRGYVLRRIIRRAIRHGHKLGAEEPFFFKLVDPLAQQMSDAFPELSAAQEQVKTIIEQEEKRFAETLNHGMKILEQEIDRMKNDTISGEIIFLLYDTYGFPPDLTADIARERELKMDMDGFNREMSAQQDRARAASRFGMDTDFSVDIDAQSKFTGYDHDEDKGKVIAIINEEGVSVDQLPGEGKDSVVILDQTPFYAEAGGQVGDRGIIKNANGQIIFNVIDTKKSPTGLIYHVGRMVEGNILSKGDPVTAVVPIDERRLTQANHSATHLLHAALRQILGDHVMQKGSLVEPGRLRFDFSHSQPVTPEQLQTIEDLVNTQVQENITVNREEGVNIEEAKARGAMALFGEKYGEEVTVVQMGGFSTELCGGMHISNTGDIELFKIISETGVAAGVRRIEACTAKGAKDYLITTLDELAAMYSRLFKHNRELIDETESLIKESNVSSDRGSIIPSNKAPQVSGELPEFDKLSGEAVIQQFTFEKEKLSNSNLQILEQNKILSKEIDRLKQKIASSTGDDLADEASEIQGVKCLAKRLDGMQTKDLRNALDSLKNKLGSAAIVLAAVEGEKINLVAGITKDLTDRLHAGELINDVAQKVGGKGGGRADMAQAGGSDVSSLDEALAGVQHWVREKLGA